MTHNHHTIHTARTTLSTRYQETTLLLIRVWDGGRGVEEEGDESWIVCCREAIGILDFDGLAKRETSEKYNRSIDQKGVVAHLLLSASPLIPIELSH